MLSRKGLFAFILLACIAALAGVLLLAHWSASDSGAAAGDLTLSFKPFTVNQLLHFDLKIDPKSCGKEIKSARLDTIEKRTQALRGLPLTTPVPFVALPEACLRAQLLQSMLEDTSAAEAVADQKLLDALGLIPKDTNLEELLANVLTEQIAGSYDPKEKDISITQGKGLGGVLDEITMSHEMTHALQDQNFNLLKAPLENKSYNGDNDLAVQSLVEGDATAEMYDYAKKYISASQLMNEQANATEMSSPELDKAPEYIKQSLLFPYQEGLTFVQALQRAGGEEAVNNAFRDPPLSSEQIIHPEKYFARRDNPRPVPLPDISAKLGKGWKVINTDTMGEFDLEVWFDQYGGPLVSREVAQGWGGNTIQYYQGPGKSYAVVNSFVWDTTRDAQEFFDRYEEMLKKRFGSSAKKMFGTATSYVYQAEGQYFYCGIAGDATLAVQATDFTTLNKAVDQYPQFPPAHLPGV